MSVKLLRPIRILLFLLFFIVFIFAGTKNINAQACSGSRLCHLVREICDPLGCLEGLDDPCTCVEDTSPSTYYNVACSGIPPTNVCGGAPCLVGDVVSQDDCSGGGNTPTPTPICGGGPATQCGGGYYCCGSSMTCVDPGGPNFVCCPPSAPYFWGGACHPAPQPDTCPGLCAGSTNPGACAGGNYQWDGQPAGSSCHTNPNTYCYVCSQTPGNTPPPTQPPGNTPPPTQPPGCQQGCPSEWTPHCFPGGSGCCPPGTSFDPILGCHDPNNPPEPPACLPQNICNFSSIDPITGEPVGGQDCCTFGQICDNQSGCIANPCPNPGETLGFNACLSNTCQAYLTCGVSSCSTDSDCAAPPASITVHTFYDTDLDGIQDPAIPAEPTCHAFWANRNLCLAYFVAFFGPGGAMICPVDQPLTSCYYDINNNGEKDPAIAEEDDAPGATAEISGYTPIPATTNGSGNSVFSNLPTGNTYSVLVSKPGYITTNTASFPNPRSVYLSSNTTVNFGLSVSTCPAGGGPTTVGGIIYNDTASNNCASGTTVASNVTVQLIDGGTGGTINSSVTNGSGSYTIPDSTGTCTNRHLIVQGKAIKAVNHGGSWSTSGFVGSDYGPFTYSTNPEVVNFCLSSLNSWFQVDTGDVRFRSIINKIPSANSAATSVNFPGIFFSSEFPADFNSYVPSSKNWVVNSEYNYNDGPTSTKGGVAYDFYESRARVKKITVTELPTSTTSLTGLNATGVYKVDGDMSINNSWATFPAGAHITLLVNGTVTIKGPITVPPGQDNLFILAAKEDIRVQNQVGVPFNNPTSTLDGIYTAQGNIILEGLNCASGNPDNRLNVRGALVANSLLPFSKSGGGTLINNRSLCANDLTYPSLTVLTRPDFLTQLTDFYKTSIKAFREVNP